MTVVCNGLTSTSFGALKRIKHGHGREQGTTRILQHIPRGSVFLRADGVFEYAIDPAVLDHWDGILCNIHGRIKQWMIYNDGNLVYSKFATILLICITCLGTRNNKHLECNARTQVVYPLTGGLLLLALSVWLFGHPMEVRFYTLPLNIISTWRHPSRG